MVTLALLVIFLLAIVIALGSLFVSKSEKIEINDEICTTKSCLAAGIKYH